jgi:transposase
MDQRIFDLITTVMDARAGPPGGGPGHPPAKTVRVLTTLHQFLREGRPWRGLRATPEHVSGSTLRRRLKAWARADNLLQQVHAVLVAMHAARPSGPDPGQPLGARQARRRADRPEPDRPRHAGHQVPLERLFLAAVAVLVRIGTVFADEGYDAERHRELCRAFGAEPCLHRRGRAHGSGLGRKRWPVERSNAWLPENKRSALRYDRLGFIVQSLLQAACLFLVAARLAREL